MLATCLLCACFIGLVAKGVYAGRDRTTNSAVAQSLMQECGPFDQVSISEGCFVNQGTFEQLSYYFDEADCVVLLSLRRYEFIRIRNGTIELRKPMDSAMYRYLEESVACRKEQP